MLCIRLRNGRVICIPVAFDPWWWLRHPDPTHEREIDEWHASARRVAGGIPTINIGPAPKPSCSEGNDPPSGCEGEHDYLQVLVQRPLNDGRRSVDGSG